MKYITEEEKQQIVEKYKNGWLVKDLMTSYGFKTKKSIYDILKKNGVKTRTFQETLSIKNPKRDMSFKKIDCPFKAYFIGLMLTDGWIHGNTIALSMTDCDVIKFVCEQFDKEPKIIKKSGNRKLQYRFCLNSARIVNELKRFGIVERKSLTLQPPKLKKSEVKYVNYIIRGIIDGDGWIRKDGKEFFICSMSFDFIDWCKRVLENYFHFIPLNIIKKEDGFCVLRTADTRNLMLLWVHIYYNEYGMERKRKLLLKRFREYN